MLRLNNSSVSRCTKNNIEVVRMTAVFDDVTRSGDIKRLHSQCFSIINDVLIVNGIKHHLSEHINLNADPEDLMQYFTARFNSAQPDMFLEAPEPRGGHQAPVSINEVKWEYPDMHWRAIDKGGAVAYFERRPVLDKAGYWVSASEGVIPRYGKSLCIADNYKRSLRNIDNQ